MSEKTYCSDRLGVAVAFAERFDRRIDVLGIVEQDSRSFGVSTLADQILCGEKGRSARIHET